MAAEGGEGGGWEEQRPLLSHRVNLPPEGAVFKKQMFLESENFRRSEASAGGLSVNFTT